MACVGLCGGVHTNTATDDNTDLQLGSLYLLSVYVSVSFSGGVTFTITTSSASTSIYSCNKLDVVSGTQYSCGIVELGNVLFHILSIPVLSKIIKVFNHGVVCRRDVESAGLDPGFRIASFVHQTNRPGTETLGNHPQFRPYTLSTRNSRGIIHSSDRC